MITFIDFEASSLRNGFPIELGWATVCDGQVISGSHLILPTPYWTHWNPESEKVHGIPYDTLLKEGLPADEVIDYFEHAIEKSDKVISDAPAFDGLWLDQLYQADQKHRIAPQLGSLGLAFAEEWVCENTVHDLIKHRKPAHRAEADAVEWAHIYIQAGGLN